MEMSDSRLTHHHGCATVWSDESGNLVLCCLRWSENDFFFNVEKNTLEQRLHMLGIFLSDAWYNYVNNLKNKFEY